MACFTQAVYCICTNFFHFSSLQQSQTDDSSSVTQGVQASEEGDISVTTDVGVIEDVTCTNSMLHRRLSVEAEADTESAPSRVHSRGTNTSL